METATNKEPEPVAGPRGGPDRPRRLSPARRAMIEVSLMILPLALCAFAAGALVAVAAGWSAAPP